MEVLTEVDRGRIEALRARDEFFWLDLADPGAGRPRRAAARCSGCTRSRSRTRASSASGRSSTATTTRVLLVYWTARAAPDGPAIEQVEVHLHISGGFLLTVAPRAACPELDALHDALGPRTTQRRSTSSTACSTP